MKIKLPTKYTRPELTSLKSKRIKKYVKKPWDPTTTPAAYNNETRARYITQLNRFANNKLKEYIEYVFRQKSLRMEKLCLQLVKHLFYNMANTHSELNKNVMDWEYVLLHAHQIGVPPEVIRNVQKKMTRKTKREKPALSAFNKPREPLIDLTASDDD
ncbi:hypothetical protein G6F43_012338 [Rhizopus delemar]|nr:hypothetical protein G6F43_012338 [Rhizopus delemar]